MDLSREEKEAQALATPEYWDKRYANSDGHEWFKTFAALETFFSSHLYSLSRGSRILHLGSGDSTVPAELALRGFNNQLCVDFSHVIVETMSTTSSKQQGIAWEQADVRDLHNIPSESIDIGFDKGTLDAMIYGSPWDPPDEVRYNTSKYIEEVYRVLKNDGIFLYITFRQPHFIKPLVNVNNRWNLEVEILSEGGSSFDYHGFIMRKA